ncbi:MAG: S41 family peptidase [Phenylobacterium sp.]|uniref:S41 family peptidase n=1 Tax=Brevundimonas sp. TaxID=1871086 RepID=UPI002737E521|nr:S41 family peptidase [Brevundimonas sp.]MDP3802926.1 S41 family peptidase [Brevundimonas sp.]MDZ4372795.1 S41 family peptidase [Phenylobacterium sp.]
MIFRAILSLLAVATLAPGPVVAQTLDREAQREVVSHLEAALRQNYVFPERIPAISAELERRVQSGPVDGEHFAEILAQGLVRASDDLHFSVAFDPDGVAAENRAKAGGETATQAQRDSERAANFGFREARRLDGGLAYIRFDFFADPQYAQEIAAGAMRFAEGAEGLIFDLRYNNGGVLEMAQFLMSYLYAPGKEQEFFDYNYNDHGVRVERGQWSLAAVPGQRSADMPVVVLTGSTSFSAAEWMAFSLQRLGRATIIGERTAGGAHPVGRVPIDDRFMLQVPIGQIRDPVNGQDFEGVGVTPDLVVPASDALLAAQKFLLQSRAEAGDADAGWALAPVEFAISGQAPDAANLDEAVGTYEGRTLVRTPTGLSYHWRDRFVLALDPIGKDLFAVQGTDDYRLRLVRENGAVSGLERVWKSGETAAYRRLD